MIMKKLLLIVAILLVSGSAMAQKSGKKQKAITNTVFVTDVDCESCAKKIYEYIPFVRGVKDANVNVAERTVTVTYDAAKTNVEALTKEFDYVKVKVLKACTPEEYEHYKAHHKHHHHGHSHDHSHAGHSH